MPPTAKLVGPTFSSRGVAASVASSVLFASLYFITPYLNPVSAELLWAIRNVVTVPFVVVVLIMLRQAHFISEIYYRVRRQPLLLLGLFTSGALAAVQIWVFGYAPLNGKGLQVALGYFLLPLVLVVIGRLLYKDRLVWWQWAAAGLAAVGVTYEIIRVGSISWETLLVALGYPVYFVLRRAIGTNHLGGMAWEFGMLFPIAIVFLVIELTQGTAIHENPTLLWAGPVFGIMSALALVLYIAALRLLIISLFGLLSYVEPALLVVASVLNGEVIPQDEWFTYGAIWCAVLVLIAGGAVQVVKSARRRGST